MTFSPSDSDFDFVRKVVREDSAIMLDHTKDYLITARLTPLARREDAASLTDLLNRVRQGVPRLRRDIVEALTTNETSFFRDVHPFDALREHILPSLHETGRPVRIWSAASSTGQEAYSVAMLIRSSVQHFPPVTILGTDLSGEAVARASTGRYTQLEVNRGLPARMLVRWFDRDGLTWQVKDELRQMVTFRELNLARPWPAMPAADVVLLRNVLIYFDLAARRAVLEQVTRALRPGGFLILGSAETTYDLGPRFERVQLGRASCHRLRAQGAVRHGEPPGNHDERLT